MTATIQKPALIEASWLDKLEDEFKKPYMKDLEAFLGSEISQGSAVYPPLDLVFNAFCHTPFDQVKVVLIGQDPYHGEGQAHGLSFSVAHGVPKPPSLQNIFKEVKADLGIEPPSHGSLISWAEQGVLLLNATLTVRAKEPKSHFGRGWETFTDRVVKLLYTKEDPLVFLLWGRSAAEKFEQISQGSSRHLVLKAPHPSPFSAHTGFLGCRHFSKTNDFLVQVGKEPINWVVR